MFYFDYSIQKLLFILKMITINKNNYLNLFFQFSKISQKKIFIINLTFLPSFCLHLFSVYCLESQKLSWHKKYDLVLASISSICTPL